MKKRKDAPVKDKNANVKITKETHEQVKALADETGVPIQRMFEIAVSHFMSFWHTFGTFRE